ncbi:MAG: carboxypeptidase regulatory-like domain-containing protein [Armatimonadota bacterium]|nr:carboxypeptidase regulatory-like domain-containing protein [Armatimonadota bacterium]
MKHTRMAAAALVTALGAMLIGGCGGGGGGSNGGGGTTASGKIVLGKIVDVSGNPVPGATVNVEGGGPSTTSLSQGTFRLDNVGTGVRRITANVSQNGTSFTGSTQTLVLNQATTSNANIQVSPSNQQAAITGTVRDANGNPLRDARVFLAVFVSAGTGNGDGSLASLVAFADSQGVYRLNNVPAPVARYTIAASLQGYQNDKEFVNTLQVGELRRLDLNLGNSVGQTVTTPTNAQVFAFTQPSGGQRPYAVSQSGGAASSTTGAVYERLRRALSPAYAARAAKAHASSAAQTTRQAHATSAFGPYAIQMDLFFDNNEPNSISGFRVYNSPDSSPVQPYDFLQDPLADVYTDLDPFYVAGRQYNFAVSAINTDGAETSLSNSSSVVPLDALGLNGPAINQTVNNPVNVSWRPISGATTYVVFLYDSFPSVDANYNQYTAANGASSLTLPNLNSGDYYTVVAGVTSDGSAVSVSPITKFHVR